MKTCASCMLALAMAAALALPAAAASTTPPANATISPAPSVVAPESTGTKSYYVTNYDADKAFSLDFSQVIYSGEPDMGNIEIVLLQGGTLRCSGDYGFIALDKQDKDNSWVPYGGAQDDAFFADRGIQVVPTQVIRQGGKAENQYAQGYTWQFNRGGTYSIVAGCSFFGEPEYLKFTVKVLTRQPGTPTSVFTDVPADAYYALPVTWAVASGVTEGTTDTTFSPSIPCTNAQILTFMWRATGKNNSWVDYSETGVSENQYYTDAVRWAVDARIIPNAPFDPHKPCTRAMAMEYFWKMADSPVVSTYTGFTDVPADAPYAKAVSWAVREGITKGGTDKTFSPDTVCTRAQIVTFLYRALIESQF